MIRRLTNVKIELSKFTKNKAVDALQERLYFTPYSKYFLEYDQSNLDNVHFQTSFYVPNDRIPICGNTEIEYLALCADKTTRIP